MTVEKRTNDTGNSDQVRDQRILDRCAALGLTLPKAMQLAVASDSKDPYSLLRLLDLDFSTYEPIRHRHPKRWVWMAARTSSVSYRGTLTEEALLTILAGGVVPPAFDAHIGSLLDEAPISIVLLAIEETSRVTGQPIDAIWRIVGELAQRYCSARRSLWTNE